MEILPVEPYHDIPGHIKNKYTELPHHLNQNKKKILEHAINTSFGKKYTKRSVDYHKSIIIVTTYKAEVKFAVLHNFCQKLW